MMHNDISTLKKLEDNYFRTMDVTTLIKELLDVVDKFKLVLKEYDTNVIEQKTREIVTNFSNKQLAFLDILIKLLFVYMLKKGNPFGVMINSLFAYDIYANMSIEDAITQYLLDFKNNKKHGLVIIKMLNDLIMTKNEKLYITLAIAVVAEELKDEDSRKNFDN